MLESNLILAALPPKYQNAKTRMMMMMMDTVAV